MAVRAAATDFDVASLCESSVHATRISTSFGADDIGCPPSKSASVSGHEKLPTGGQFGARRRPRGFARSRPSKMPTDGQSKHARGGPETPEITRRRHHRPTPSSEYSRWGEREGLGCVSQLGWLDRTHGARVMPVCDSEALPGSARRGWSGSTDGWEFPGNR